MKAPWMNAHVAALCRSQSQNIAIVYCCMIFHFERQFMRQVLGTGGGRAAEQYSARHPHASVTILPGYQEGKVCHRQSPHPQIRTRPSHGHHSPNTFEIQDEVTLRLRTAGANCGGRHLPDEIESLLSLIVSG